MKSISGFSGEIMSSLPEYFVHFGSSRLDRQLFEEISNISYCGGLKPFGGLWGSNENGYGWSEWCHDNEFNVDKLEVSFKFKIQEGSRVLNVLNDELKQYSMCQIDFPFNRTPILNHIDWEKVKSDYDAVYIAAGSNNNLYHRYYGWDCDSILVLNFDAVEEVE
jgi:hypothetical protein